MNLASPRSFWPRFLLLLALVFLALTGWSIYRAGTRVSAVTDAGYYSHGLRYNHTRIEQQAAAGLGWTLTTALEERRLQVRLLDRSGAAVSGASGELTLYAVRSGNPTTLPLVELAPGQYTTRLPAALQGEITGRLRLQRDGAQLSRSLMFNF
jgi:nitrogen fixation protein FixH